MTIVIIGSGNVATVLGYKIHTAGHSVLQVVSKNLAAAQILASSLKANATNNWASIKPDADLYLIALPDAALHQNLALNIRPKGVVAHTAGAVSMQVLSAYSKNYGVIYPLQTLRKEKLVYDTIPMLINGNNNETILKLQSFAASISKEVSIVGDSDRLKLHVAAVFVNNFCNYLFGLAADYCQAEQVSFNLLQPLIEETALRLRLQDPRNVQTGPAIRHDAATITSHLALLKNNPKLYRIYQTLTLAIQQNT